MKPLYQTHVSHFAVWSILIACIQYERYFWLHFSIANGVILYLQWWGFMYHIVMFNIQDYGGTLYLGNVLMNQFLLKVQSAIKPKKCWHYHFVQFRTCQWYPFRQRKSYFIFQSYVWKEFLKKIIKVPCFKYCTLT